MATLDFAHLGEQHFPKCLNKHFQDFPDFGGRHRVVETTTIVGFTKMMKMLETDENRGFSRFSANSFRPDPKIIATLHFVINSHFKINHFTVFSTSIFQSYFCIFYIFNNLNLNLTWLLKL